MFANRSWKFFPAPFATLLSPNRTNGLAQKDHGAAI
jgi:hypothetical protein